MQPFKIRASAIGSIMGYPEKDTVPAGAVTYLKKWVKEQLYGKTKEFTSKYTDKGIKAENEAIDFASRYFGWGFVEKNQEDFDNGLIKGTPDIILHKTVEDIKNSWDCFTFPLFEENPDQDYWWQLQGYMSLTGKQEAGLIYCLMDAHDEIVEQEAKRICLKNGLDEIDSGTWDEVKKNMTYSNLPDELRIKRYTIVRDDEAIKQIENRVLNCRKYIEQNLQEYAKVL